MRLLAPGSQLYKVAFAVDRFIATLFGFPGNKTLSAECGDHINAGTAGLGCKCMCGALDALEKDHCKKAAESEKGGNHG